MFQRRVSALSFVVGLPTSRVPRGTCAPGYGVVWLIVRFIIGRWGLGGNRLPCNELCRDEGRRKNKKEGLSLLSAQLYEFIFYFSAPQHLFS